MTSLMQQLQQQQASSQALFQAEQEMDAMTDVFNRMLDSCFKKCVPNKYLEAELNKGESVCIDRCVVKYLDVHQKVGQKLTAFGQQAQQQLQQQQEASATQPLT